MPSSLASIFHHGQSVLGHLVREEQQGSSSRLCHRNEFTVKAREKAVQGLGNKLSTKRWERQEAFGDQDGILVVAGEKENLEGVLLNTCVLS